MNNQLKQPTTKLTKTFPIVVLCLITIITMVIYYLYRESYVFSRVRELKGIIVDSHQKMDKPEFVRKMHGLKQVLEIGVNSPHLTEEDMKLFGQCKYLERLILVSDNITDDWLIHLTQLKRLNILRVYSENITDEGLIHLGKINSLVSISIRSSSIEGSGLSYIKDMPHLGKVGIKSKKITDEGVFYLSNCKHITYISVRHSKITNEGLALLCQNKTIEEIDVQRTRVTLDFVKYQKLITPHIKIIAGSGGPDYEYTPGN